MLFWSIKLGVCVSAKPPLPLPATSVIMPCSSNHEFKWNSWLHCIGYVLHMYVCESIARFKCEDCMCAPALHQPANGRPQLNLAGTIGLPQQAIFL